MFAHLFRKTLEEFAYVWKRVNLTVKKVLPGGCEPRVGTSAPGLPSQWIPPPPAGGCSGWWVVLLPQRAIQAATMQSALSFFFLSAFVIELRVALHPLNNPDSQNFCSARAAHEINVFTDAVASAPTSLSWSRNTLEVRCWAACTPYLPLHGAPDGIWECCATGKICLAFCRCPSNAMHGCPWKTLGQQLCFTESSFKRCFNWIHSR